MILNILYFLFLLIAAVEDYRHHTVSPRWVISIGVIGLLNCITKENRWVTLALTCACFLLLYLFYRLVQVVVKRNRLPWKFGGADVRLIPGMMLMQGWDVALTGVFLGLVSAVGYYLILRRKRTEIPLVPWMLAGCVLIEIVLLLKAV